MSGNRRMFLLGAGSGVAACVAAAAMIGMAEQPGMGAGRWVTSGSDGRTAYLWEITGDQVRFLSSSRAPRGHEEMDEDRGKPEEKGKPADKGKPEKKDRREGPGSGRGGGGSGGE